MQDLILLLVQRFEVWYQSLGLLLNRHFDIVTPVKRGAKEQKTS